MKPQTVMDEPRETKKMPMVNGLPGNWGTGASQQVVSDHVRHGTWTR